MSAANAIHFDEREGAGRVAILRLRGRLDGETALVLLQRCEPIKSAGRGVVLNLAGVTFLGSSGVGALLVLAEQFQEPARIRFAEPSRAARAVIELLDLSHYLTIDDSEDAALAALAGGEA